MLDINYIRQNPQKIKQGCENKQVKVDIDKLLDLDKKRRELLQQVEVLRRERKSIREASEKAKQMKEKIKSLEQDLKEVKQDFDDLMLKIPNPPLDDVPIGKDEQSNKVIKQNGKIPKFSFKPKDHLEIGERLNLIDVERAAKVVGARFSYLKNELVLLEFALINFVFNVLKKKGFIPIIPPVMIKPEMASGMGFVEQTNNEEAYHLPKDNLYLIGTSEQTIGAMHANEVFEENDLPRRYVGFSTCFRREAGSYGKDTKGILRVHQFDKVEMFSFCKPEESIREHKMLLAIEEELMQALKLPYQVVHLCTGGTGKPSVSTFDIETWMPGQNKYRETHSTSNCTDFQARRLKIRYRDKYNKSNLVHTLNGTAFAIGRILIAILENYQKKDNSIEVPKVLRKYLNFKTIGKLSR